VSSRGSNEIHEWLKLEGSTNGSKGQDSTVG
jgi:hypothetical protein